MKTIVIGVIVPTCMRWATRLLNHLKNTGYNVVNEWHSHRRLIGRV